MKAGRSPAKYAPCSCAAASLSTGTSVSWKKATANLSNEINYMPRIIKSGLIQMSLPKTEGEGTIEEIKEAMIQKNLPLIEAAGKKGVQILCLQEIFDTPYFCPGQNSAWYASAETIPGPTIERMAEYAKKNAMVMI